MFVKGKSGNPSGRPHKRLPDGRTLKEAAMEHAVLALETLAKIAQDGESDAARVSAANSLLDRGFGKPTQPISGDEDEAPIQTAIDMSGLSLEAVREIAKLS
jgi:hypothetical protein